MHPIQLQVYLSTPQNSTSPVLLIAQATGTVPSYSLMNCMGFLFWYFLGIDPEKEKPSKNPLKILGYGKRSIYC